MHFLCCADAACLAKLHQNWGSCATLGLRPLKIGPAGLKIIRPTAIRTNFSDGLGLQKSGLGQDRVPEKVFLAGFGFLVTKGTKSLVWVNFQST